MKKRFLSILTSFASIITVVSAVPHTQCAGATEDGYPEQPPYQYIGDDAVEFVDREMTYYFRDEYNDKLWEFNKVYSLSQEYVKSSFDIQEIRNNADSACVVCRPMHPETEPAYIMELTEEELDREYNVEPDNIYVADGFETPYSLVQPKWWDFKLKDMMLGMIVNGEERASYTVPHYDFNHDGVIMIDDVIYVNKIYSSIPSMWVTNLEISQIKHEKMDYGTFIGILEVRYAEHYPDKYPEITIRFGESWRLSEKPVDETVFESLRGTGTETVTTSTPAEILSAETEAATITSAAIETTTITTTEPVVENVEKANTVLKTATAEENTENVTYNDTSVNSEMEYASLFKNVVEKILAVMAKMKKLG